MMVRANLISSDRGRRWNVEFDGDLLIENSRGPEHDACRALLARGITGRVTFYHPHGTPGLSTDIVKGAGLTVDEATRNGAPRVRKYRSFPPTVSSPARVSPSDGVQVPEAHYAAV